MMNFLELETMWSAIADILINLEGEIEVDFYYWQNKERLVLIFGIGLMKNCRMESLSIYNLKLKYGYKIK